LLPITYQKLKAEWLDQERVPKTTRVSPASNGSSSEVRGLVLEVGVEDRRVLAGRVLEAGLERGALATVLVVEDERHVVGPFALAQELARAVGRAVVDDHELTRLDRKLRGQGVVDRPLDGRALVEHRHEDRKRVGHARQGIPIGSWHRWPDWCLQWVGTIAPCASSSSTVGASQTTRAPS
jgi:hypothetical protein